MQSWQFFRQNTLIPRWEREIRVKLKLMLWVAAKRLGQKKSLAKNERRYLSHKEKILIKCTFSFFCGHHYYYTVYLGRHVM